MAKLIIYFEETVLKYMCNHRVCYNIIFYRRNLSLHVVYE